MLAMGDRVDRSASGVADAIALACTLHGEPALERLAIVGVAIDRPAAHAIGLSLAVAEAIGPAAALAAALANRRLTV